MTVLLDTGPLVAFFNKDDPLHPRADALVERALLGSWGLPVTTDFVLDEGLTLLRRRPGRIELSTAFAELLLGTGKEPSAIHLLSTPREFLDRAWRIHIQHYERGLSFTDCTLAAHAEATRAVLATFDSGFDGIVPVVES